MPTAYLSEFMDCCGITILSGFERVGYRQKRWTKDDVLRETSKKSVEEKLISEYGDVEWDDELEEYLHREELTKGPGLILIALNERQYTDFEDSLKTNKFKMLSEFVNPNTGNTCRLYGRKRKQPRKPRKAKS